MIIIIVLLLYLHTELQADWEFGEVDSEWVLLDGNKNAAESVLEFRICCMITSDKKSILKIVFDLKTTN